MGKSMWAEINGFMQAKIGQYCLKSEIHAKDINGDL